VLIPFSMYVETYRPRVRDQRRPGGVRRRGRIAAIRGLGLAALVASGGAVACRGHRTRPGDLSDSAFVAVMAELRRAIQPGGPETTRDSAGRQAVRDSIMRKYHTSAAAIESTASHLSDPPSRATDILRAIDRKVVSLGPATPPPRPVQPPPPTAAPGLPGAKAVPAAKPPAGTHPSKE
jgi:hypothetical protein